MIVEDDVDTARTLAYLLRDIGHAVEYAINGYAALSLARSFRPDVVLLDLGLPGLDGVEVARRLAALPAPAPPRIIAVTALSAEHARLRLQGSSIERVLVKPVSHDVLLQALEAPPPTP